MRSLYFFFSVMFVFVSCETNEVEVDDDDVASESLIDQRFATCYYEDDLAKKRADSVLISILGKSNFNQAIQFDLSESSINCQVENVIQLVPFGDTNYCVPNSYDLLYDVLENGKSIFEFRMLAGSDMEFEPVSTIVRDQLRGYRKLLDGEFKISYTKAVKIAKVNGVDFNESNLELVKDEKTASNGNIGYHWEAELEYDHNSVVLLWIDVMTGETSKEVLSIKGVE